MMIGRADEDLNRLYNDAYVQAADAMIPYYPNMDEDRLNRHELSIVL